MRRVFIIAVLLASAAPAFAQNQSTQQMVLANSSVFTTRLQYLMEIESKVVLAETKDCTGGCTQNIGDTGQTVSVTYTPVCHAQRTQFASGFIASPAAWASASAVLVSSSNVVGAVLVNTVVGSGNTADSTAADLAVATAIANFWNTLAKCVTNP